MTQFSNSIQLGIVLPKVSDVQGSLDALIKQFNNTKIVLDVSIKDNTVIQTLEKLNSILTESKSLGSGISLGNISSVISQTTQEALKLSSELKNVSSVNFSLVDNNLKSVKVSMQDTENEAKKLSESLNNSNSSSGMFSGVTDFLSKAGLFYGVAQAIQEVKTQLTNCFEQAEKMDSAFSNMSITMNLTKEQFADMSDKITEMGIKYGQSSNEIMNIAKTYANNQSSVEEVMEKVKPDLWLANVSKIDSSDITRTLQSVTNQFSLMTKEGMSAEQATTKIGNSLVGVAKNMQFDFVDGIQKLTDAVKTGGSVAENAKMSLDDYLSSAGAFIQQTGMSGSEYANALKMISARILKQKELGAELGISEKEMADAEKALDRFNISTRDSGGNLRSLTDILKDTSVAFNKMSDSDKQYTANKLSGVNNSSKFIAMMQAMNTQQTLYNATQTDTNALMDAQQKHAESLEGRIGSLKATYEGLMNKMMNSDTAKELVTEATNILSMLSQVDGKTIAFTATVGGLIVVMSKLATLNKTLIAGETVTGLSNFIAVLSGMSTVEKEVVLSTGAMKVGLTGVEGAWLLLTDGIKGAISASIAFMSTGIGLVITGIAAAIGVAVTAFTTYKKHQADLETQSKSLKEAIDGVNESLKNGDVSGANTQLDKTKEQQEQLEKLVETRKKLESMGEDQFYSKMGGSDKAQSIALVQHKIDELTDSLKSNGLTVDENTGKINELTEAQDKVANAKVVEGIKSQTKAQLENRENMEQAQEEFNNYTSSIQDLYSQYQNLSAQESLSAEQKQQLGTVVEELQGKMSGLNVSVDENGQAHVNNSPLIEANIEKLNSEGMTVDNLSAIRISDAKACSEWQVGNTQVTYSQITQRIAMYKSEIQAIQALIKAKVAGSVGGENSDAYQTMSIAQAQSIEANSDEYKQYKEKADALRQYEQAQKDADAAYQGVGSVSYTPTTSGGGSISANPESSSGSSGSGSGKSAETEAKEAEKSALQEITEAYQDAETMIDSNVKQINADLESLGKDVTPQDKLNSYNDLIKEQTWKLDELNSEMDKLNQLSPTTSEGQESLKNAIQKCTESIATQQSEIAKLNTQIKELAEDNIKSLLEQQEKLEEKTWENYYNTLIDNADAYLKKIQEQNDALSEQNSLAEKQNALEEAKTKLENVENNKTNITYTQNSDGSYQYKYVADKESVAEAKKAVEEAKQALEEEKAAQATQKIQTVVEDIKTILQSQLNVAKQNITDKYSDMDALTKSTYDEYKAKYGDDTSGMIEAIMKDLKDTTASEKSAEVAGNTDTKTISSTLSSLATLLKDFSSDSSVTDEQKTSITTLLSALGLNTDGTSISTTTGTSSVSTNTNSSANGYAVSENPPGWTDTSSTIGGLSTTSTLSAESIASLQTAFTNSFTSALQTSLADNSKLTSVGNSGIGNVSNVTNNQSSSASKTYQVTIQNLNLPEVTDPVKFIDSLITNVGQIVSTGQTSM